MCVCICGGEMEGRAPVQKEMFGQGLQGLRVTSFLGFFDQRGAEWWMNKAILSACLQQKVSPDEIS